MVYKKQSHFLFPFSRLDVHRYASRLEERKISPKIPLSPEYQEGSSSFFELELPSFTFRCKCLFTKIIIL